MMDDVDQSLQDDDFATEYPLVQDGKLMYILVYSMYIINKISSTNIFKFRLILCYIVPALEHENACTKIAEQLEFIGDGEPDDNIPISYQNALVFNETYQNHLHSVLDMLQESLQDNRNRQEEIELDLVELEQGRTIDYHRKQEADQRQEGSAFLPSNPLASNTRKAAVSIFAAPYFKVNDKTNS